MSAAYRDLTRRGWVESRQGSGVYVRSGRSKIAPAPGLELDRMIADLFEAAHDKGFSLGEIQARLQHWFERQPPDHFLVIEPAAPLRQILVAEIQEATGFPVRGADPESCVRDNSLIGAAPVFFFNKADEIRARIPGLTVGMSCEFLLFWRDSPVPQNRNSRPAFSFGCGIAALCLCVSVASGCASRQIFP